MNGRRVFLFSELVTLSAAVRILESLGIPGCKGERFDRRRQRG
jgi:hypothetical protein